MDTSHTLQGAIVDDLGLGHLSKEVQEQVLAGLTENILKSVVLKLLTTLSPEDRKDADEIAKGEDTDVLLAYLKTKIPNMDELVAEETKSVVAEFKKLRAATH